jgi:nuclear factor erythroid 2-related factor 1/3
MKKNEQTTIEQQQQQPESKDEIYLRQNHINLTFDQIVNSSAENFNEIVENTILTDEQTNFLKDMRRRAKNKIAAQVCRKRKLETIDSLNQEVDELNEVKSNLKREQAGIKSKVN